MARCEQGYLCEECGEDVADITESDLYLRYVLGEVHPEVLHLTPERHIRCNPTLGQFIVAPGFEPIKGRGYFAKETLDPEFVAAEEKRVTGGYLRLLEIPSLDIPITEYPPPEIRARWQSESGECPSAGPSGSSGSRGARG